ncbi:ABC transporter permease [Spirosoma utsteinense]|uniref:ABC transport system permease protein n=1 Tax=Spirosoma utsteinense TaxID=2585773 RepID=A0ABR6W3H2_9BACT|nr:ABC transporter permease [Spirosoma utsteinense]MBC3785948.1 putative ABC transport system permease protein [Spirosoma utsteinense]MBC3790646.1 putative ABC transport system permease protein [Spirosoma utsteinense]
MNLYPPRLATRLLHLFCAPHRVDELEDDLDELFQQRVKQIGLQKARWRYVKDVVSLMRPSLMKRQPTNAYPNPATTTMLRNYLKIAFRNLVKNKTYSSINIGGLALGIAVSLLILLFVIHERTYDHFHANADRIFRVYSKMKFGEQEMQSERVSARFGLAVQEANAGVLDMVRVATTPGRVVIKTSPERKFFEDKFILADPSFLTVFSFPLVDGSAQTALLRPMTVLLTERTAERYFGHEDPVGKTITYNNKLRFEVTGVLKNPPSNSTVQFDFVASLKSHPAIERIQNQFIKDDEVALLNQRVQGGSFRTYFLLNSSADTGRILRTLPGLVKASGGDMQGTRYIIDPLTSVHLGMNFGDTANSRYLTIFLGIAALILLLALINYMSLTTARATQRAREVGVRKVMGAGRSELAGQFYGESMLITGLAFLLALVLVKVLRPPFYQLLQLDIDPSFMYTPEFGLAALGLLITCVLLSGSYPAVLLSSFSPVNVLKGNLTTGKGGPAVRRVFTVIQFTVSIGLIGCSMLIYQQVQHLQNRKLGLYKDRVLVLPVDASLTQQYSILKHDLRQIPGVERVAAASSVLYKEGGSIFFTQSPTTKKDISIHVLSVDDQFAETLQIPWKSKPDPTRLAAPNTVVLNEIAVRKMGIGNQPLGQRLSFGSEKSEVVGVMRNFYFTDINDSNEPLALFVAKDTASAMATFGGSLYIRIQPSADLQQTVGRIETAYHQINAEKPFEYYFLDQTFNSIYKSEARLASLFSVFTGFALFIACLGLFGLAAFTAEQRTKEIGVRKVLGASVASIVTLLSKDFIKLVLLALVIASPISWWAMNKWLQDFAYKIDIAWWVFALAGGLTIGIALLTVSFQSIKAALMNPVKSLRSE